jgi:hypothetical protein
MRNAKEIKMRKVEVFRFYEYGERKVLKCNIRLCIVVSQHNTLKRILNSPAGFKTYPTSVRLFRYSSADVDLTI